MRVQGSTLGDTGLISSSCVLQMGLTEVQGWLSWGHRQRQGWNSASFFAAPKLPWDFGAVTGWLVCRGTLWPHSGVVGARFRGGGYPLHLPFLWGHMVSHSASYFFLQSGFLCLIIQKHITNNDCFPNPRNLSALLPISIRPASSYCSSEFKEREYKCSLASR